MVSAGLDGRNRRMEEKARKRSKNTHAPSSDTGRATGYVASAIANVLNREQLITTQRSESCVC